MCNSARSAFQRVTLHINRSERLGKALASIASDQALIEAIAAEMSSGIECAVSFWMTRIQDALQDPRLTTLGRMHAIQEIMKQYHAAESSKDGHDGYAA